MAVVKTDIQPQNSESGKTAPPPPPPNQANSPPAYELFSADAKAKAEDPTTSPSSAAAAPGESNKGPRPTITEAAKTIKPGDLLNVHKIPCARQGYLTGIGAGALVGAGRYIGGAPLWKAANWAVGAFAIGGILQWEYCQYQRYREKAAMTRVVEVMERRRSEKAAEQARIAEAAEKARQEVAAARKKSWYRFW